MQSRIFLIGFMGSGKSTLGELLAKRLGYAFVDMDDLIVQTSGMTVPEIFSEHGEEMFRKWEHDILLEIINREKVVIATGGGAPCHMDNMALMRENGLTVYLQLSPAAIRERLIHSKTERPLVKGKNPEELLQYIKELLEIRDPFYLQSGLILNGVGLRPDQLIEDIKKYN